MFWTPYYGAHDTYDYLRSKVIEDNCPEEFLRGGDSSDDENDNIDDCYEDQENSDTDEDSVDYLADRFNEFNVSNEDSEEEEEGYDQLVHNSSDDVSIELGGFSSGHQSDYE